MASKENILLALLFNEPKQWHFEELMKRVKIGRPQLARWLRVFEREGIIKRVKVEGKMPYYIQDFGSPYFRNRKRLFAYQMLVESGMLDHLAMLKGAKVVVLFGSFIREDWYKESDIDIFLYGDDSDFEQGRYELKLKREIQVHNARNAKELKSLGKLLPYIVSGQFIKGNIEDLGVSISAKA